MIKSLMKPILVIVESPAKCKKIEEYLGSGYKCIATYGHVRCIDDLKSIDIKNNFEPTYSLLKDKLKLKQIERIRNEINSASDIILATDDDREGESIAWHVCQLFNLPVERTKRIVFHEITQNALNSAISRYGVINLDKVKAQQSRQIVDLLVGYTLSPLLWKNILCERKTPLSAGRCQSVALKIIYENHLKWTQLTNELVYNVSGYFTNLNLLFTLNESFTNKSEMLDLFNEILSGKLTYSVFGPITVFKPPPEPLITSTFLQLVYNELKLSPKIAMQYAQELYEKGYITYMRTDCKKYSKIFIDEVSEYILTNLIDEKIISKNIDNICIQLNNNLEAHEAIRPTSLANVLKNCSDVGTKIYNLILKKSLESCMSPSQYNSILASITVNNSSRQFQFKSEQMVFKGWEQTKKVDVNATEYNYLLNIKDGTNMIYKQINGKFTLKHNVSHYNESSLIKRLEEKEIGRPSTYAMLVDKNIDRKYVKKQDVKGKEIREMEYAIIDAHIIEKSSVRTIGDESGKLVMTPLGITVIEYLLEHCSNIVDYDYTRTLEFELDMVTKGIDTNICKNVYNELQQIKSNLANNQNDKLLNEMSLNNMKNDLDINSVIEGAMTDNTLSLEKELGKYKGFTLTAKSGKYGIYAEWDNIKKSLKNMDYVKLDDVKYADVLMFLEKDDLLDKNKPIGLIRELTNELSIRTGKYGDYIMFKKIRSKNATFHKLNGFVGDYKKCDKLLVVNWIKQTYKID